VRNIRYLKAVSDAVLQEMEKDNSIFYMGEDVRCGLRGISRGFMEKFGPDRVINTPISESGFVGIATGAAMEGMRPILEFEINEFVFFAFDELIDQAQKYHYMSGGKYKVPVTYLVPLMLGSMAGQHSDYPYAHTVHAGMKTILPSTPYDAKGLIISAIRDNDPVMVFLPTRVLAGKGDVPEGQYSIPFGQGDIKREGDDITVVATGHMVIDALNAAKILEQEGISLEIYDPRTLLPLDIDLLVKSVNKTGRAVIFDDSNRTCGFAAEIAAIISDKCFESLKAPVKRVTRADCIVPFSPLLEKQILPKDTHLIDIVNELIK